MKRLQQQGFTIPELLVVLAIIGILTTIVMVNFRRGEHSTDLRRAGTELQQYFRFAQSYSIGGNSIKYCDRASDNFGQPCENLTFCPSGDCITAVPLGGYGIHITSPENYTLYGDTTQNSYYEGPSDDYSVIVKQLSTEGIHISSFKLGDEAVATPSGMNFIDVTFEPPTGTVHFFLNREEARDASGQLINTLDLLVQSDYVSYTCRKVSINRVTGQISEVNNPCSLQL